MMKNNIKTWLIEVGEMIKQRMAQPLDIKQKTSLADVVTNVDKEVEVLFRKKIDVDYPTHRVIGEEGVTPEDLRSTEGDLWIIDPIDGTLNFVKEQHNFAVMIAYYKDGVGQLGFIYDVMAGDLYIAEKDSGVWKNDEKVEKLQDNTLNNSLVNISANLFYQNPVPFEDKLKQTLAVRILGSSAMSFIRLINGHHQGYVCLSLNAWDYMAGLVFLKELGLVVSTFDGNKIDLLQKTTLVAGLPSVHQALLN